MDLVVCCMDFVFQCLNLVEGIDCEPEVGRVRNRSLLSVNFERRRENILIGLRKTSGPRSSAETATLPFRYSATSDTPPIHSTALRSLSFYTVSHHASPGQDERVQSLRRIHPQPIHSFLQKCRAETTPTPLSGKGFPQKRVHKACFCYRQGHQYHNHPPWKAGST